MAAADAAGGAPGAAPCEVARMPGQLMAEEAASKDFQTFLDLLPSGPEPAIHATDGRRPLSFAGLRGLAGQLDPAAFGVGREHRLCVVLPNGPESASAFLALSTHCVYAPLNIKLTEAELAFELEDLPARAVVVQAFAVEAGERKPVDSSCTVKVARQMDVPILELTPDLQECGVFSLAWHEETPRRLEPQERTAPRRGDLAVVLHTSGTTKKPKIVPLTHENIAVGSQCIASTLQLKASSDLGINIMPLFHIHGLSINVLASMLSGAPILATPGFELEGFFRWLEERKPTWYSAVPTMHQQILEVAQDRQKQAGPAPKYSLQLVRNCSAALLPHVAEGMEKAFGCVVMPTYAMTESMPIASNPRTADRGARKLRAEARGEGGGSVGSVGLSGGPRVRLCDDDGGPVQPYSEGEVCVSGECVTAGYELRDHMDADPNKEAFHREAGGRKWLRTGDKGWVDGEGFLALTGRFKEIINRGGEKVSPLEVEEVLRTHPGVRDMIAFAAPHEDLGETVGAAVVPSADASWPADPEEAIQSLRRHGAGKGLNQKWLPDCIVFLEAVPKGPTGKPARINLAGRLHLPSLSGASRAVYDVEGPPPVADKAPFAKGAVTKRRPPQPPKPGDALQGARVAFNFLVWFNHVGYTNSRSLQQMRNNAGFTMTVFEFLLGFSMASSVPEAGISLAEVPEFWVSRLGPAHGIFALAVTAENIQFNMRCDAQVFPVTCRQPVEAFRSWLETVFTCFSWLHNFAGGYMWFSPKMYWFILGFPLYDYIMKKLLLGDKVRQAGLAICTIGSCLISPVWTYLDTTPEPYTVRTWSFCLASGMFAWHVFRLAPPRSASTRRVFAVVTDVCTLLLLVVLFVAGQDTCCQMPSTSNPFGYTCNAGPYEQFMVQYNSLKQPRYWNGRFWMWFGVYRLCSPLLFLWLYGLNVGAGWTAWLLSRPIFSKLLGPLAYNVYILQLPAFWTWWFLTRGLQPQVLFNKTMPAPVQCPLPIGESVCLFVLTYCFSWFYDRYMSVYVVPAVIKVMSLITWAIFTPLTSVGLWPRAEKTSEGSTIEVVQQVVRRLTGDTFGADHRLEDLNLDSFGTMALIGMLKAAKPHLGGLRASTLQQVGTLGGLAAWADAQDPSVASASLAREKAD